MPKVVLLIILSFSSGFSFSQVFDQTDLSTASTYSSFTPNENTWLNKQGFYVLSYNWSDKQVNTKLNQAIMNRIFGKVSLFLAVGCFATGGLLYLKSEMADEAKWKNDNHKIFFQASAVLGGLSVVFPINARSKVKKAVQLRVY